MAPPAGYGYYKTFPINGTTVGAQSLYQTKLTVYKGTGSDGAGVVYLNNRCQDDFDDVRFTKSDGETLLDFWQESLVSGTSCVVWIELDSIPISPGSAIFYIYYSNAGASSASDGTTTFPFFDDFSGDFSKWSGDTASFTISSGIVSGVGTGSAWKTLISNTGTAATLGAMRCLAKLTGNHWAGITLRKSDMSEYYADLLTAPSSVRLVRSAHVTNTQANSNFTVGSYAIWDIIVNDNTNNQYQEAGVALTGSPITTNLPNVSDLRIVLLAYETTAYIFADWILLRNWTTPEPTWGTWGSETAVGGEEKGPIYSSVNVASLVSASRVSTEIRSSSNLLGDKVSASRNSSRNRSSSTLIADLVSASRVGGLSRSATIGVGSLITASRLFAARRYLGSWTSPVSGSGTGWSDISNAYDGDVSTYTLETFLLYPDWGNFLELDLADGIECDTIKYYAKQLLDSSTQIDVDIYYDGDWNHLYQGEYSQGKWQFVYFDSPHSVSKARVRFYHTIAAFAYLYEFSLGVTTLKVGMSVTCSKWFEVIRNSSLSLGISSIASRLCSKIRNSIIYIGNNVSASKLFGVLRYSISYFGIITTTSKIYSLVRTALTYVGVTTSAWYKTIVEYVVHSIISVGVIVAASKSTSFVRSSLNYIGWSVIGFIVYPVLYIKDNIFGVITSKNVQKFKDNIFGIFSDKNVSKFKDKEGK